MNGKDWTNDPIVVSKVKRVSARPEVADWLDAEDSNHRERALLALAVAHTIAWQPRDKRPYGMLWLDVYEIDGGIGGRNGRSVQVIGDGEGCFVFAPGHMARLELAHELCRLLYPADGKVKAISGGGFWWHLLARRNNRA